MKKQPDREKITALYERLSHDDERAGESVSIENQKRILEDYAAKNGFTNIRHFTDDGVRGTTFKRPGLDAMLDEIRAGNVATVIIKDQSRIGRDVVEVGLLKRTFDEYHVRFIAANDNLDTANGFDIMSIFRDVINEWYVADTSRKIKTVFKSRMEKGLRCSGSVSYGYLASKENKGEWVIDEEAAAVVRRIFHSIVAGESIASIARALRAEKVPIPSEHWKRIGAPVRAVKYADPYAWSASTIGYKFVFDVRTRFMRQGGMDNADCRITVQRGGQVGRDAGNPKISPKDRRKGHDGRICFPNPRDGQEGRTKGRLYV